MRVLPPLPYHSQATSLNLKTGGNWLYTPTLKSHYKIIVRSLSIDFLDVSIVCCQLTHS